MWHNESESLTSNNEEEGLRIDMLVIAHRGANREAPENSWSAFERAIEAGSDRIELDVQLTKDNEAVILHDPDLKRLIGTGVKASKLTRKEFESIQLADNASVPFLDQVVAKLLPRIELNIEIKPDSVAAAQIVADIVSRSSWQNRVIISSFQPAPLIYLAEQHTDLAIACLWGSFQWRHPWAFLLPFTFMKRCRATTLHPEVRLVTKTLVNICHQRGFQVVPYVTLNGEEKDRVGLWQKMQAAQVDGLCSNYPRELKQWLGSAQK